MAICNTLVGSTRELQVGRLPKGQTAAVSASGRAPGRCREAARPHCPFPERTVRGEASRSLTYATLHRILAKRRRCRGSDRCRNLRVEGERLQLPVEDIGADLELLVVHRVVQGVGAYVAPENVESR
jgi:hypothetical protein